MVLDDIETYLNSIGPFTASGKTFAVRKYYQPESPDETITLQEFPAGPEIRAMGESLAAPVRERVGLMVITRSPQRDPAAGRAVAEAVHVKLSGLAASLSGRQYYISAMNPPYDREQDRNNRWEFEANYVILKERG